MWPGRVSLLGGDQPVTLGKTLGLPENSIPIRQQPGRSGDRNPRHVAENQRRNKELAALGEEKGTEGTRRFEQESKGYSSEPWGRGGGRCGRKAGYTRTGESMQMRDVPQVYTKTKFNSTACLQKQGCHSGQGPPWKGLGDLHSHPGRAPPGATAWGAIGHVTVMDLTLALLTPRVFWGSWRKNQGRLGGPLP